jgi:hypothetical protein
MKVYLRYIFCWHANNPPSPCNSTTPMRLDYLLFDFTDEEDGSCSFDALASVARDQVAALLAEVECVLAWAYGEFGAPAPSGDQAEWDFELQAAGEADVPLEIGYDATPARVRLSTVLAGRVTLALTVSGSRAFGDAFRQAFPDSD